MAQKTSQSTKKQAKWLALKVVGEVFDDPDFGKELSVYAKKRLRATRSSSKRGRMNTLSEIKAKYL